MTGVLCEACRKVRAAVLLVVDGITFRVCSGCAADPDRETGR